MTGDGAGREIKEELLRKGVERNRIISVFVCSFFMYNWDKIKKYYDENCICEPPYKDDRNIYNLTTFKSGYNVENMTILSLNCAGGCLYHSLKKRFLSPTINLFFNMDDYLKFISNLRLYIEATPVFLRFDYKKENVIQEYPIYLLNDIELHMNHTHSIEDGKQKWEDRKQRIIWENIIVLAYTDNYEVLKIIDGMPYKKKICFVPFSSDLKSAFSVDMSQIKEKELWDVANRICLNEYPCYFNDLLEKLQSES